VYDSEDPSAGWLSREATVGEDATLLTKITTLGLWPAATDVVHVMMVDMLLIVKRVQGALPIVTDT
jgi:hypothetical protein